MGILAGTHIATANGSMRVENIRPGDQVFTIDGGMQTVQDTRTRSIDPIGSKSLPFLVPANTLGNRRPLLLLPDQAILVDLTDDHHPNAEGFVMVLAAALDGFRGVREYRPAGSTMVVDLQFEHDEVVLAETGACLCCPRDCLEPSTAGQAAGPIDLLVDIYDVAVAGDAGIKDDLNAAA